jgi:4-diphosphocytidyl-2-C-methyl-D-erythritol kinase
MLTLKAPAKINLALEVTGKRPDGYHEIKTIIQAINLYDELLFEPAAAIQFKCSVPGLPEDNLVMRAARMLKETFNCSSGVKITLHKGIPVSGGLGGGSSDAGATLKGLNEFWKLGLCESDLTGLAARLGSDVPFFIHGGTALAEGRGELISLLPELLSGWIVLMLPAVTGIENKTRAMYSRLTAADFTDGKRTLELAARIREGRGIATSLVYNAFDRPAEDLLPGVKEGLAAFRAAGAENVHVAGSGPSIFALAKDREEAEEKMGFLGAKCGSNRLIVCQFSDK